MITNRPIVFIYRNNGKYAKYFLEESPDEIKRVLLDGDTFEGLDTGFSGFHDWLHADADPEKSNEVVGVEIFPFKTELCAEFYLGSTNHPACEAGVTIIFEKDQSDFHSGGEQSFAYHQYFKSGNGRIAVALDLCDLSVIEFSAFKSRCRDSIKIIE